MTKRKSETPPGEPKDKGGRPEWEPACLTRRRGPIFTTETQEDAWQRSRNYVRMLMGIGIALESIGELLQPRCSLNTVRKHFAHELSFGKEQQHALIAGTVIRAAMAGDVPAARFYLERKEGWTAKVEGSLSGMIFVKNIPGDEGE